MKTVSIESATPTEEQQNRLQSIAERDEPNSVSIRDDVSNVSYAPSAMISQKQ